MWDLIEKLNILRNKLAHSLGREEEEDERIFLPGVVALCLGFVHSFHSFELEVERFKKYVAIMDRAINPHRWK